MSIRSLKDLQPGDIMISGMSTAPTKLLVYGGQLLIGEQFRIGPFVAGHAGIISPSGRLIEAMPHGARIRDLRETDWSPKHAYFRLLRDHPEQHQDAASIAVEMIGTPYSLLSYAYLGAYRFGVQSERLAMHIDRRHDPIEIRVPTSKYLKVALPVEAICSVLVEQAWTLAGKKVIIGTKPQVVTPGMLTQQLYGRPGVIRGGAGIA